MQSAGEGGLRVEPGAQGRQPAQDEIDLGLAPLGRRRFLIEHAGERARCRVDQHPRRPHPPAVGEVYGRAAAGLGQHRHDLGAGEQARPRRPGHPLELGRHLTHAAHGDPPLAGAAADHVVQEAAILAQTLIIGGAEGADQSVGQQHSAYGVVAEGAFEDVTDRLLHKITPGLGRGPFPEFRTRRQRLRQRRFDHLSEAPQPIFERAPGGELAFPTEGVERSASRPHPAVARPGDLRRPPGCRTRSDGIAARDQDRVRR